MSEKQRQVYELLLELGHDEWHTNEEIHLEHKLRGGPIERYEMTAVLNSLKASPTYGKRIEWERGRYKAKPVKLESVAAPKQEEAPWDTKPVTDGQQMAAADFVKTFIDTFPKLDTTMASSTLSACQSVIRAMGLPTKTWRSA